MDDAIGLVGWLCVCWAEGSKDRQTRKGGETRREENILCIIRPRLHQNPLSAWIAEPEMMHQRALPHFDSMPASELLLAHQSMEAPVPVVDIAAREMSSQAIFFDPVQFEVAERFPVPASDGGEAVLAVECLLEEGFLVFDGAGFAPAFGDARLVHPVVEEVCVAGVDVDVAEGGQCGRGDA